MATERASTRAHADAGTWVATGILGGIVAGIAMAMVAMVWMALAGEGFWKPLSVIASILMGKGVISGSFELIPDLVGMMVHLLLSAVFGLAFTFVVRNIPWPSVGVIGAAIAYALLLWIVNVRVIDANLIPAGLSLAPTPLVIVVHLVYGVVLGLIVVPKLSNDR